MAELRKSKELNDRLDYEARALRNRIRAVDSENSSLQLSVSTSSHKDNNLGLKHVTMSARAALKFTRTPLKGRAIITAIPPCVRQVVSQQEMVRRLESALAEQRSELQLLTEHVEARQANEVAAASPKGCRMLSGVCHWFIYYQAKLVHCIKTGEPGCISCRPRLSKAVY